ncbi:MAG: YbaB/EbfC family nucleoid-associated protein [Lachnospiraceae bacterium]|nr:YbaB/EbfC family nucleoid-associated protein [Lachnospiraceae bacterium]
MARRGGYPGGMMPGNMNNLMKQAQRMQKQMEETTAALEEKEYEATAGGGVVKVTINGKKEVTAVHLEEEVVDKDDIEMLEDLIMAAVNEAIRMQDDDQKEQMGKITGGLGGGFPF